MKMGHLNSMNIFLRQEIDRMQKVITILRSSLSDLKLAIEGTIIMSEVGVSLWRWACPSRNGRVPLSLFSLHGCTCVCMCSFVSEYTYMCVRAHTCVSSLHVEGRGLRCHPSSTFICEAEPLPGTWLSLLGWVTGQ